LKLGKPNLMVADAGAVQIGVDDENWKLLGASGEHAIRTFTAGSES
jgi:hypothetical protein